MIDKTELKARVLRNELAIIIGCQDGRSAKEKAEDVIAWMGRNDSRATIQPTAAEPVAWGKCVWCEAPSTTRDRACSAPDGDGHMFNRVTAPVVVAPADAVMDARNEQDAARYRFLRDSENNNECVSMLHDYLDAPHQIDRAIDAAIARETPRAEITTAAPIPNPPMTHLEAFGLFGEYIDKEPAK